MTLTKLNITDSIQDQFKLPKRDSEKLVETLLELIKKTLASGEEAMINGFGKFCVKDKKQRESRNPATGETMVLDARRVIVFQCSGKLRDKVNDGK